MGPLARLFDWLFGRDRRKADLSRPTPTPTTQLPSRPMPTATTRPLGGQGGTAGTQTWGAQGGTPSTQRLHNSPRIGR